MPDIHMGQNMPEQGQTVRGCVDGKQDQMGHESWPESVRRSVRQDLGAPLFKIRIYIYIHIYNLQKTNRPHDLTGTTEFSQLLKHLQSTVLCLPVQSSSFWRKG